MNKIFLNNKFNKYKLKYLKNNTYRIYKLKYNYYKNMIGGFEAIDAKFIKILNDFINNYNNDKQNKKKIDSSHGISHMLIVLCHTHRALQCWDATHTIGEKVKLKIRLSALLHDIDDHKYFPNNHNYENARLILTQVEDSNLTREDIDEIIQIIKWVPSSINGDKIPSGINSDNEYYLYPRYADRLEAIGIIGLERTLHYTKSKEGKLFNENTQRATDERDLFDRIATIERYKSYSGNSVTMIDHFYDKLLRLGKFPIRNEYFDGICEVRNRPLIDIILEFGKKIEITEEELEEIINNYIRDNKEIGTHCCSCEVDNYIKCI
jgi:uncharacterized protein